MAVTALAWREGLDAERATLDVDSVLSSLGEAARTVLASRSTNTPETMHLLPIPHFEDLQLASGRTVNELERELRLLLAVKVFELKRVSIGQAADIAGLGKLAFMDELGRIGVPVIDFGEDQLDAEFRDV